MEPFTLKQLAHICGGFYAGDDSKKENTITSITTDSRKVSAGCLFAAIKGTRSDGHDFVEQVLQSGAVCCLIEKPVAYIEGPYIIVSSTLEALKAIAEHYRRSLGIKVIGITGSVGKTSTKEMISSVLSVHYNTLKTEGNFNNELGLPLTVFRLKKEHEIAILEMGISDFGEMHRLSKIAQPDIVVITNIGYCHLENLIDQKGILKAKSEIFDFLPENGTIILNGDDEQLSTIIDHNGIKPTFFGTSQNHQFYADQIKGLGLHGIHCQIHTGDENFPVDIPLPGRHMVYNALAATAVGKAFGLTAVEIKQGIEALESLAGRFHIIETEFCTIIDDCYNANPISMKASLDVLSEASGRTVALLGDMFELGTDAIAMHAEVGGYAARKKIDCIVCTGSLSENMAQQALLEQSNSEVISIATMEELMEKLPHIIKKGDTVLVKASHGMHFEEIVKSLQKNEKESVK